MTIPDRTLRQYLAGALEPPEQERVERILARAPALRERLGLLLTAAPPVPEIGWVVPPPNTAPIRGTVAPVAVMDAGAARPGWVVIHLDVGPDQRSAIVVVLERRGAAWDVLFPTAPDEVRTAEALAPDGGPVRLDLALPPGEPRRVAVVLVPADWDLAWDAAEDERWARAREAVGNGDLQVVSFDVEDR